ncbi:muconolactone Delta-isomerase family protein [Promicromonospora sp. NPDC057488]|uniref:muconolactone Delta-isomerase family protein n=1 Tax=Promicromonospora sp. NPDC057488 TaxID=3346147 RepID=UPI00366FB5BE
MEYLVTMTTRVPDGTTPDAVDDVRAREAAHTRELAARGRVLRLWRPPLAPGEWRTLGLFTADDADDLERTLTSMPLRVWRTDEVTPLGAHPNDPGAGTVPPVPGTTEHLVTFTLDVPAGASPDTVAERTAGEARRTRELAAQGRLVRLWSLPTPGQALGLWQHADVDELYDDLRSLPLAAWLTVETVPLTPHPSDPGERA